MITQELLDYIKHHKDAGQNNETIKQELLKVGWHEADIDQAFGISASGAPLPPAPLPVSGRLSGPVDTLKQAWSIYAARFWTLVGINVIPVAVIFAISFLTAGGAAWLKGFEPANNIAAVIAFVVLIVLIVIAAIYIYVWAQAALIHAIKDHTEPIGIKEAFRRSSHKIDAYFMASILVMLATVGGFILFIVPGIIFAVWYSLACYIVIGEDAKPVQALKKSRAYVRGSWWSVFGRLLFLILLYLTIYIPAAIVISIIINASGAGKETADTIGQYAGQIVSLLTTPLFAAYGYQVYSNLKALKGPSNIPA